MRAPTLIALCLVLVAGHALARPGGTPFDEETLDRIQVLNRTIADHYERLQATATELDARRAAALSRADAAVEELSALESERSDLRRLPEPERVDALRTLEERRIDLKSRSLEALAEKHAIDLEAISAFEDHAAGILENLDRLGDALERSGAASHSGEVSPATLHSVQRGTAVALATLEEWGTLTREDPRFRSLWATARVLNRAPLQVGGPESLRLTVELVRDRAFVVRSLVDQARALRSSLDQQGLLLQVAAQNQMLRLHTVRLGVIGGLELPDLRIEATTRHLLEDIEEEPYTATAGSTQGLRGFDDCLNFNECR